MKNLTMGSLYLGGEPLPPGYHIHEKTNLSLGNTAQASVGTISMHWDTSLATQFASTGLPIRAAAFGCGVRPTNGMKF